MDKNQEYLNELTDLLEEIDILFQEKKAKESVMEAAKIEFQKASNDAELSFIKFQNLTRVFWYCIENRCDPTQAKLLLSLDDFAPQDSHTGFGNISRGSQVGHLPSDWITEPKKKASWWKNLFKKEKPIDDIYYFNSRLTRGKLK
jgi:hypothetical protein